MEETNSFGYWVRRRRKALDLTQEELARRVSCALTTIKKIELDQRRPSQQMATRLAECLHIPAEEREAFLQTARAERSPDQLLLDKRPIFIKDSDVKSYQPERTNLPVPVNRLVGRQVEIAALSELLLSSEVRLVTLVGTGGVGKTRLALEVAARLSSGFPDGAWLVELAPLSDPALIPQEVASALGLRQTTQSPVIDLLSSALHSRRLLLVLDNCEHLVEACALLAQTLLTRCPYLSILATSREHLRTPGEVTFPVPPLDLPGLIPPPPLEELSRSGAVGLFLARGQEAQPDFNLTAANASEITLICRRLDGLPLALELAAARVRTLRLKEIYNQLDDAFRLLTSGSRTAPLKHQTLQATLDWSYALLTEQERILFRRLSVFAGGFTLNAAEAVCPGDGIPQYEVLNLLTQLVDKSLVEAQPATSGLDYRLLELVRQYAREKLSTSGELAAFRDRHFQYYLQLGLEIEPKLRTGEALNWLDQIESELGNLRLALEWSLEGGGRANAEYGLSLASALLRFWTDRCYFSEGFEWLERGLDSVDQLDPNLAPVLAQAFAAAGTLASERFDSRAGGLLEKAAAYARMSGDEETLAHTFILLAKIHFFQRDPAGAQELIEESIATFRRIGDSWGLAMALSVKAGLFSWHELNFEEALACIKESIRLFMETGDRWEALANYSQLGWIYYRNGDHALARSACETALESYRENKDRAAMAYTYEILAKTCCVQEDYGGMEDYARQGFELRQEVGHSDQATEDLALVAVALLSMGDIKGAAVQFNKRISLLVGTRNERDLALDMIGCSEILISFGERERAARLMGAVEAIWSANRFHPDPAVQRLFDRATASARASLDEAAFAGAWAKGGQMTQQEAVQEVSNLSSQILSKN